MKIVIKFLLILLIYNIEFNSLFSQINKGGTPKSFTLKIKSNNSIKIIEMPCVDNKKLLDLEKNENREGKPYKFAYVFEVNINIKTEGSMDSVGEVGKIWRLRLKSSSAYSLNFTLTNFNLPIGAELFLYNKDTSTILGAFTSNNNTQSRMFPIMPIVGDEVIFEYFEPNNANFKGNIVISRVGHDYKGFFKRNKSEDGRFGNSGNCNVDINCPEGNNWQNEKRSVCRLLINNSGYCSGALVNNVNNDGIPYILTAHHCVSTNSDANNTVFVFNYESPTCNGSDGSIAQSISGSTLRATWSTSDFTLLELSSSIPENYNPYFSGWFNINTIPTTPVVGIHHPAGDVKKISRDNDPPTNSYGNTHWFVDNWDVGTTEGGSSGSPLYNSNHRIVGQVHAGDGYEPCDVEKGTHYGKLSTSWTGGGTDATRLQNWLDPSNTVTELPGLRLIRNITITSNTPASGDIVRLINVSIQNGSNITIDINELFEATGTFDAPLGITLNIQP
ncbi:MAG: trypsin-like peptidase domain-containing protein [Bacteroidales bacterium]